MKYVSEKQEWSEALQLLAQIAVAAVVKECVLLQLRGKGIEAVVPGKLFFQCFGIGGKLPSFPSFMAFEMLGKRCFNAFNCSESNKSFILPSSFFNSFRFSAT